MGNGGHLVNEKWKKKDLKVIKNTLVMWKIPSSLYGFFKSRCRTECGRFQLKGLIKTKNDNAKELLSGKKPEKKFIAGKLAFYRFPIALAANLATLIGYIRYKLGMFYWDRTESGKDIKDIYEATLSLKE